MEQAREEAPHEVDYPRQPTSQAVNTRVDKELGALVTLARVFPNPLPSVSPLTRIEQMECDLRPTRRVTTTSVVPKPETVHKINEWSMEESYHRRICKSRTCMKYLVSPVEKLMDLENLVK